MMKKIVATIVCLLMTVCSYGEIASGTCGKHNYLNWSLGDDYTLTIEGPDDIPSYGVNSESDAPWYSYCNDIKKIVISDNVTGIGVGAFGGLGGLTSVTIGNSVKSIGIWAFGWCPSLTSVTIPNSVTTIGAEVFLGCTNLTSVTIGSSVTSIGEEVFKDCSSLSSVTVDVNNKSYCSEDNVIYSKDKTTLLYCIATMKGHFVIHNSVMSLEKYAFKGCSGLTSVTIPNSVTIIEEGAFYDCSGLTTVTIPNSVTSIGNQSFYYCSGLTSVTIGNSVTSIGEEAFDDCYGLTSLTIPNSVTSIGSKAFRNCRGCTSVTIGNSVTSIGSEAFYDCSGLSSVTIPNSVTTIGESAFSWCSSLTSITIPSSVTSIGRFAFSNTPWYENQPNGIVYAGLVAYTYKGSMPDGTSIVIKDGTKGIGDWAFYGCSSLTSVTIPNSVTSIGGRAFGYCSGLTSVTIPNSVTSIGGYAFSGCSGLTSVTIPNSVMIIEDGTFWGCSKLTTVTIGNSVTNIENHAFTYCDNVKELKYADGCLTAIATGLESITEVTIPNSVTSIGYKAFYRCSGLTSVTIPNSVTTIGEAAFEYCTGLTSATIPNSVTSIGKFAFSGCSGLTSVTIPNSVTNIGWCAFSGCTSLPVINNLRYADTYLIEAADKTLSSYSIKEGTLYIGDQAFYNCSNLTSVTIPHSVTSIGEHVFWHCSGLTDIIYNTSSPLTITESVFDDRIAKNLHVYYGTKKIFEAKDYWKDFNIIEDTEPKTDVSYISDAIYSETTEGFKGHQVEMKMKMKNSVDITSYQVTIELPEGVSIARDKDDPDFFMADISGNRTSTRKHSLVCSKQADNTYYITCASSQNYVFTGSDGEVATITLNISDEANDILQLIKFKDIVLTESGTNKSIKPGDTFAYLIVNDYIIGDANDDGELNISDYSMIISYLHDSATGSYNVKAMDVNGDGEVNISDASALITLLHNQQ